MRLINTRTLEVKEFPADRRPRYAILSHRWLDEEISFQQIQNPRSHSWMKGFEKVAGFCEEAARNGFDWAWVDTCCIDKTSAVELSEAINSMFAWYRDSTVCYVYLDDFSTDFIPSASPSKIERELKRCVWFTRGWTLQELIAPKQVLVFDYSWRYFGTKNGLADVISRITNINVTLLRNQRSLDEFSCAQKMSWAAFRQTTRPEDRAYSLLGLFDITLPSVYGEGHQAFLRLQEAILIRSPDHSLFAWTLHTAGEMPTAKENSSGNPSCILAPSPDCFYSSSSIVPFRNAHADSVSHQPSQWSRITKVRRVQPNELRASSELPYLITNMGLQISFLMKWIGRIEQYNVFQVALNCYDESEDYPCASLIYLVQDEKGVQAQRAEPRCMASVFSDGDWEDWETTQFLVMPIWLPPKDTNSMLHRSQRLKMDILASAAFSRMKEVENVELRKKQKEQEKKQKKRHSNWLITGAVVLGSIGCLATMKVSPDPHNKERCGCFSCNLARFSARSVRGSLETR
jgi:Heterokaryon incompatibility protein (HET)